MVRLKYYPVFPERDSGAPETFVENLIVAGSFSQYIQYSDVGLTASQIYENSRD